MDSNYCDWAWSALNFPFQGNFAIHGDGSTVHDTSLVIPAKLQDQVARCNVPSYQPPVGSEQKEFGLHRDSSVVYEALQLTTPANFQSQVAQPNASGYQLPIDNEHEGLGLQGDGSLVYDLSQFDVPANLQDQVAQSNAPSYQLPVGTGNDTFAVQQYGSVGHPQSRSVAPTLSQVDTQPAQPIERSSSIPPECPVCRNTFRRVQERNRHLESYLPHSIHCPSRDCHWTGRRQSHFKEHWDRGHSKTDKAPGRELNEIYDPKEFVNLIVDGTSPVEEVARSAFLKARERLAELGKDDVGEKVWGRNKKLPRT